MYAYVKFLSGPLKDKKKIVEISCIQHFHKETHQKIMKYQIKHDKQLYPGCILLLSDSKEKIRELMDKKRSQSVPSHLLMSAPEETNSDSDNAIKESKSSPLPNTENLQKLLSIKLQRYDTQPELTKTNSNTKVSDSRMPFEDISNELDSVMVKNTNDSDEAEATQKPAEKKSLGHSNNKDIFEKKAIEKKQSSKKVKIQQVTNVHSVAQCNVKYEELKKIQAEFCKVKEQNKELQAENKRLKDTNRELKEKLQAKKSELQKVRNMNEDLQLSVIEKSKEYNVMIENLTKSTTAQILYQDNFPPIGSLRTTDNCPRVHIGRDQWIDDKLYNRILNNSNTPRQCACNILTAVFLEETLLVSTKTGLESNRKIRGRKECPKLDETKYGSCEDFYIYWMKNIYKPNKDQEKNYLSELNKFDYFVGKKIAELKRPARENQSVKSTNKTSKKRHKQCNKEIDENTSDEERSKRSNKSDVNDSSLNEEDAIKTSKILEETDALGSTNIMSQQEIDPETSPLSSKTALQLEDDVFDDSYSISDNDTFDDNNKKSDDATVN